MANTIVLSLSAQSGEGDALVKAFVSEEGQPAAGESDGPAAGAAPVGAARPRRGQQPPKAGDAIRIIGMRKVIAQRMHASLQTVGRLLADPDRLLSDC